MNKLEIHDIKNIELKEIDNSSSDIFNWSKRELVITNVKGDKFTVYLYSDFLDKRLEDETFIDAKSADLHNDLVVKFRKKKI
tara:strand:+ start:236 stop:481 length:246 start_codon:yes stop_codon:yes gene_type:complete